MKILVTGAKGFVGRNLCSQLNNIKTGKAKCYGDLVVDEIFEYDLDSSMEQLDAWCSECDFVFNLAGVNRPQNPEEFMTGNFGFASTLLDTLKKHGNKAPVMLSSSAQASLTGRFGNSEYGRSKKAGEELFFQYAQETGAKVAVYRFVNLMGQTEGKSASASAESVENPSEASRNFLMALCQKTNGAYLDAFEPNLILNDILKQFDKNYADYRFTLVNPDLKIYRGM